MTKAPVNLNTGAARQRTVLSDRVYEELKQALYEFRLLPGERISETEIALQTGASRTPVREALTRLMREGFVTLAGRSGWQVRELDFAQFDQLYEVRTIIELAAIDRLCMLPLHPWLPAVRETWEKAAEDRLSEPDEVFALDEEFHATLVRATGNPELAQLHTGITDRIRIVRQLDFTEQHRIEATYDEHAAILQAIGKHRGGDASRMMRSHIDTSRKEVRKISLNRLFEARKKAVPEGAGRLNQLLVKSG